MTCRGNTDPALSARATLPAYGPSDCQHHSGLPDCQHHSSNGRHLLSCRVQSSNCQGHFRVVFSMTARVVTNSTTTCHGQVWGLHKHITGHVLSSQHSKGLWCSSNGSLTVPLGTQLSVADSLDAAKLLHHRRLGVHTSTGRSLVMGKDEKLGRRLCA